MRSNSANPGDEVFTIERRGELTVITATEELERIEFGLEETVSELILKPIKRQEQPQIVFDLSRVDYFGSMFLAVLLRCWKLIPINQLHQTDLVSSSCCSPGDWYV